MKKLALTTLVGAACLGLAACGDSGNNNNAADANTAGAAGAGSEATGGGEAGGNASGTAGASSDWPTGTRVVEEGGVTYRVSPDGTRTRIEGGEVRIVTENGVRYRVNREGTRVRINEQGIDIDLPDVTPSVKGVDVDLGTNRKGNLDLDVNTNGRDASRDR